MKPRKILLAPTLFIISCATTPPPPPAPPVSEAPRFLEHTVKNQGETLGVISEWYTGTSVNWKAIAKANPTLRVKSIKLGDTIVIPEQLVKRRDPMPASAIEPLATSPTTKERQTPPKVAVAAEPTNSSPSQNSTTSIDSPGSQPPSAAPNASSQSPDEQLYDAAMFSDAAQVSAALKAGANPNYKSSERSALCWVAQNGDLATARVLVEAGADLNAIDSVGHTALMRASDVNQLDMVKYLLSVKANPNVQSPRGDTALSLATRSSLPAVVTALLAGGADPNTSDGDGNFPLLNAVQDGNTELVKALATGKADLNRSNIIYTPLSYAIEQGRSELVTLLLDAGANPNAKTQDGRAPLILAIGNDELVGLLLQHHADPNITNSSGDSALMVAVENDATTAIESLIKAGADINAKTRSGESIISYAQTMAKNDIVELLKRNGATQ